MTLAVDSGVDLGSYGKESVLRRPWAIAKVGEEALELALAATGESRERAVSEYTDVLYALLVLAVDLDLRPEELAVSLAEKKRAAGTRGPGPL